MCFLFHRVRPGILKGRGAEVAELRGNTRDGKPFSICDLSVVLPRHPRVTSTQRPQEQKNVGNDKAGALGAPL
jgi:hypothetical protein